MSEVKHIRINFSVPFPFCQKTKNINKKKLALNKRNGRNLLGRHGKQKKKKKYLQQPTNKVGQKCKPAYIFNLQNFFNHTLPAN